MNGFLALFSLFCLAFAQIPLPDTEYQPPSSEVGAEPSNSSSVPNIQWSNLLGNMLYFYEAQRSGNLTSARSRRVSWRNDSCTNDGEDVNLDLSGGYYDAGDYIKATFPFSFTLMSLCWGAMDSGKGYDLANQTAYLDDMLRWGLDWLIKAHPADRTLFVQVANTDIDNAYWGGDQNIPTPRPSYQINDTSPGTDAAAGASAAFAACSALYSNTTSLNSTYYGSASLANNTYSDTLYRHAVSLYDFAINASGGQTTYQTSVPDVGDAYSSSSYGDELTIAAVFLGLASSDNSSAYYEDAVNFYSQFKLQGEDSVFNWDSKTPGVSILFSQICQSSNSLSSNLSTWQTEAERYLDSIVNNQGPSFLVGDGLLFYDGDSDDASINPALNAAMLAARYAPLASSEDKKNSYLSFSQAQVDYVLGNNPMSMPYIVGSNPNAPSNPHSAMASGGDDISNINTVPLQEAYILYGAVVGGPDKRGRFFDIRSDWPETEVALDYNAPMLTLAAMHVINDTSDPYYTSLSAGMYDAVRPDGDPCDAAITAGCGGPSLSLAGKIVLGVCIGVVGLIIVALLVTLFWVAHRSKTS